LEFGPISQYFLPNVFRQATPETTNTATVEAQEVCGVTWVERRQPLKVGDEVMYSRQFLKSIACHTGDMPRGNGKVAALVTIGDVTLAEIDWDLPDLPDRVNVKNLCLASRIGFEL
jgi:hypothetical protein